MLLTLFVLLSILTAAGSFFAGAAWYTLPFILVGSFLGWLVLAFLFLVAVVALPDSQTDRQKDSRFYRSLTDLYIELIISLAGIRFETKGLELRPREGRFLLVSNHLHEIDPAILMHFFPKAQLAFIAKKEAAGMFLVGKLLPRILGQYINRENDREALKTILKCISLLKTDEASVGVFPEGGINEQRKFKNLKPGVFKIAQKAKVPIVVCTLQNTQHVVSNLLKLKRTTVTVHLLEVVSPQWMEGKTTVEISDYVHSIIAEDLGPENLYVEENT